METWGVVDAFCTRNRCLNPSRSIFKWFWKFAFFWLFHLWVFAIFRPVEYSTGPESAEYRPEMLQLPQGPSQKKWKQITRRYSRPTLKYVFQPQIDKIAYFMSSLFISCHSWFFVAEMLLMWKYEISAFRIWSQNVRIVFRSKLIAIWSSVEVLVLTYFTQFHMSARLTEDSPRYFAQIAVFATSHVARIWVTIPNFWSPEKIGT